MVPPQPAPPPQRALIKGEMYEPAMGSAHRSREGAGLPGPEGTTPLECGDGHRVRAERPRCPVTPPRPCKLLCRATKYLCVHRGCWRGCTLGTGAILGSYAQRL
ncbi:hypothetical protein SKAU_G00044140 [Synaphobranchus kaupii]|uniref:Uncharacterized protein n=1 Tax=Synaphobranchus kaupii TaxID=118154 RepID=A0A9Q1G1R5_SYNKA|nr:hypothetical protein SKAU_G00044140 [Synaphobranchus kaupii]